jgi:hypothetical protein
VETPSLVIARGAWFSGRTRMYRPVERSRPADAPDPGTVDASAPDLDAPDPGAPPA